MARAQKQLAEKYDDAELALKCDQAGTASDGSD
jgi:hypothetical protein